MACTAGSLLDRRLSGAGIAETPLGSATTDARGRFRVAYDLAALGGKVSADLTVRAVDRDTFITEASVCRAGPHAQVTLVANGDSYEGPSEYTVVEQAARPLLTMAETRSLSDAQAELVACSARLDPAAVRAWAAAAMLAQELPSVPAEIWYGLLRQGLPADGLLLLAHPMRALREALEASLTENRIAPALRRDLDAMMTALEDAAVQAAFAPRTSGVGLGVLVAETPGVPAICQQTFVRRALQHEGTAGAFWASVQIDPDLSKWHDALRFTADCAPLVASHPLMVRELHQRRINGAWKDARDLARLTFDDWRSLVDIAGTPQGMTGSDATKNRATYAAFIARAVESRFRTAVIADRVSRADANGDLATFFAKNPDFTFDGTRVATYLAARPKALDAIASERRASTTKGLKKLERLYRLTTSYEQVEALANKQLDSAQAIHGYGQERFVQDFGKALGAFTAEQVFTKACWTVGSTAMIAGMYSSELHVDMFALPKGQPADTLAPSVADWTTLFGTLDACSCKHCASVLGPSAYLVDLLEFLGRQPAGAKSAKDLLLNRRPDIARLELTCDASDTPLPYVDLVNEILEISVAAKANPPVPWPEDAITTARPAGELLAAPEIKYPASHRAAYTTLANAVYPFEAPFHLWSEEARIYLRHLGVARRELLRLLAPEPPPPDLAAQIAAERLGLSLRARDVIAGVALAGVLAGAYWGLGAGYVSDLQAVPTFLRHAALSMEGLRELLATGILGVVTLDPDDECDVAKLTLSGLTPAALERAHRFLRLRNALSITMGPQAAPNPGVLRAPEWTITELGKTVDALGPFDSAFLERVAALEELRDRTALDVTSLLVLWAEIDRRNAFEPSLFERWFLSGSVLSQEDPAFRAIFNAPNGTPAQPELLAKHKAGILSALSIGDTDLQLLTDDLAAGAALALPPSVTSPGDPDELPLTLAVLSRIARFVILARALGLEMRDLVVLHALGGLSALDGDSGDAALPQTTIAFVKLSDRVRASGMSVREIDYVVRHVTAPKDDFAPTNVEISQWLDDLAAGIAKAAELSDKAEDPAGERCSTLLLDLLADEAAAKDLIAVLDGTSNKDRPARLALVTAHLERYVEDLGDAQSKLVGIADNDPGFLADAVDRFSYLVKRLERYAAAASFVKQHVAAMFGLELRVANHLLSSGALPAASNAAEPALADFLSKAVPGEPAGTVEARRAHLLRLHKAALLIRRLRVGAREVEALFRPAGGNALARISLASLPVSRPSAAGDLAPARERFHDLVRVFDLVALRDCWKAGAEGLFSLLALAAAPGTLLADVLAEMARQTSWTPADLAALADRFGIHANDASKLADERALERMEAAASALARLGASAEDAIAWTDLTAPVPTVAAPGAAEISQNILRVARAKCAADTWATVAKPLRDALRERQRQALVAYLVARDQLARGPVELYERLLVDVEMSACMTTSRTVQAAAAVQLFVQRVLLGLIAGLTISEDAAHEWEWMSRYRVWEANRKVFLHPENWIEPELRDDKTPLFRAFESRLTQGPLSHDLAEDAYRAYLEELHGIAHLEVVAMVEQEEGMALPGGTLPVRPVHVFARTLLPHTYYYRRLEEGLWTPWEKIDLDIQTDHLLPVIHNRRLHLFWPELVERPSATQDLDSGAPAKTELRVTFAASTKTERGWTKKRLTKDATVPVPVTDEFSGPKDIDKLFFLTSVSGDFIRIACFVPQTITDAPPKPAPKPAPNKPSVNKGDEDGTPQKGPDPSSDDPPDGPGDGSGANKPPKKRHAHVRYAVFKSDPCTPRIEVYVDAPKNRPELQLRPPPGALPDYQAFARKEGVWVYLRSQDEDPIAYPVPLLNATPAAYTLAATRDKEPKDFRRHLFYKDGKRTFFLAYRAETVTESTWVSLEKKIVTPGGTIVKTELEEEVVTSLDESYRVSLFYHPHVCAFLRTLAKDGLDGLLRWAPKSQKVQLLSHDITTTYKPSAWTADPFPKEDVNFRAGGAYSIYNWELFFHAPFAIAVKLSRDGQYAAADRWFRYIFDPADGSGGKAPQRFWKVKPFFENNDLADIQEELVGLSVSSQGETLDAVLNKKPGSLAGETFAAQIAAWRRDPFNPYAIARLRPIAYQKAVVMRYLDNLLAWGDALFREDTRESVAEATQLYLLASNILGPRPTFLDRADVKPQTYASLGELDAFSNALVELESVAPPAPANFSCGSGAPAPASIWGRLYFCIPPNDKLLGYWDIVADRLWKIRHCANIEGVGRELPLFEPPIDPALLVRAKAAGVDLASVLTDLHAGPPLYRFPVLHAKAVELASFVTSLGAGLLGALERRDAEHLALLRSKHEIDLAEAVREVRKRQIDEAQETLASLERSRAVVEERRRFYAEIPKRIDPEKQQLFAESLAIDTQDAMTQVAHAGVAAASVPDFSAGAAGAAASPVNVTTMGGGYVSRITGASLSAMGATAGRFSMEAGKHGIEAAYQRREQEWKLQKTLAEKELAQLDRQIEAAKIRLAIAEKDLENHETSLEQAREVRDFFRDKHTNEELFDWMVGQTSGVYFQGYRLAYELAKRAEKAFQYERGDEKDTFIKFGYWDGLRQGLLAGERLSLDLRRLEAAYLERNKREYEITKHVSLASHAPLEVLRLREEGHAELLITEEHYDQDHPTHYMRRLKSVSVTLPCVKGAYQSVNGKLTLLGGEMRTSPAGDVLETSRGAVQSIVTSSGQSDAGMFDLMSHDDRFLPFEGVGAQAPSEGTSHLRFDLSQDHNRFDFDAVSDLVLTVRYTARDGRLGPAAPGQTPFKGQRLFSAKQDFATAWQAFVENDSEQLTLAFAPRLFARPQSKPQITMKRLRFYTKRADGAAPAGVVLTCVTPDIGTLSAGESIGSLICKDTVAPNGSFTPTTWTFSVSQIAHADLADIWIIVDYSAAS